MNAPHQPAFDPGSAEALRRSAVLIVEDEQVARHALATLLSAYGYETAAAGSAEEALEILRRRRVKDEPQIALVDLNLPGMNGLDFITRLERLNPDVFPVLMTASAEECVGEAVRERHLAYLRKPLDFGQLLTVLTHGEEKH